jgi:5-methylthioadenosine/S-adenosylhomocysteine deaminase
MVSKGCTACYDLFYEFPMPSADGISTVARAYADVGTRAVIAPMMNDSTFYSSVLGLLDAIPDELRGPWEAASKVRSIPWERASR